MPSLLEHLRDAIRAVLRAGEDEHAAQVVIADEREQQVGLLLAVDRVDGLRDRLDRLARRRDVDADRVVEHVAGDAQ